MLKKIPVHDVQTGMFLQELVGAWIDHPFWKTQFVIADEETLQRLKGSAVKEVWIDISKGRDVTPSQPTPASTEPSLDIAPPPPPPLAAARPARQVPRRLSTEKAVERAQFIKHQAKRQIDALYQEVRLGKAITTSELGPLVEDISASVLGNPGVFTSLARLKSKDDYTYLHSVTVCALMIALGRQLGLTEDQLREAGMAGLLHDMGKARIPLDILNKPGKLTDAEFAAVREHPRLGHEILQGAKNISQVALDVCLQHHERFDGKGYPSRLSNEQLSLYVRMSSICDVYDAITSDRPYKTGWDPAESVRRMALWAKDGHFDPRVFQAFVKSIGIYPTGSLVKLQSGRLAVVLEQNDGSALTPLVKAFFSIKSNLHVSPEIIDLAKASPRERIVSRELAEDWNIKNLDEIWKSTTV